MAAVRADEFAAYDAVLDGIGLMIEWESNEPYEFHAPDNVIERQDFTEELSENKLDGLYWGENRSWHDGAGQKRFHVPGVASTSAFLSSKGVDVFGEKGEATLLHETSLIDSITHASTLQRCVVANDSLFVVTAQPNLRKFAALAGPGANISTGTTLAVNVEDLTTDGETLYIALNTDGVHRITPGAGAGVHWSDAQVTVVEFAKATVWGLGMTGSPSRCQLLQLDAAAASVQKHLFPENQTPVQMCELGPILYIAMRSTNSVDSWIYAYDGNNAPFVALPLPPGDIVTSMTPFLGAGLLVGVRRVRSGKADAGVVYIAFPQGQGHLVLLQREVAILGEDDTNDARNYLVQRGTTWGRQVYFAWPYDDGAGLGTYFPETAAYSRHLYSATAGQVGGIARWRDHLVFTVQGTGLYVEQDTYVASGTITSSVMDVNVDADKTWTTQSASFEPLPTGTSVSHEYSTDGTTFSGSASQSTAGARALRTAREVVSQQLSYRVTLTANGAKTSAPVLRKAGLGGWPASKKQVSHRLLVRAFPGRQLNTGERTDDWSDGWQLLSDLASRRKAGTVLDYQPPWWRHDQTTVKVRLAAVRTAQGWTGGGDRIGGLLELLLKEVDPT